jgi:hypothetical protein
MKKKPKQIIFLISVVYLTARINVVALLCVLYYQFARAEAFVLATKLTFYL